MSKQYAINNILLFLVTATISIILAYVLNWGLIGMVIGLLIGSIASLAYSTYMLRFSFQLAVDIKKLKEMLKFSIPLVPSGMAIFFTAYTSRLMINHYLSLTEVGIYGIGFRVASVVILLISGFNRALMPLVYKNYKEQDTPIQLTKVFRLFIGLSLLFFVGLSIFSSELIIILTTPDYYESSKIVILLVPGVLLSQMYIFSPGLAIAKKTHYIMWINIGSALISIFANWSLIKYYGYIGAAFATLITYLIIFIVRMRISQKYYYIPYKWNSIVFSVLLATPLAVSGFYIGTGSISDILIKLLVILLLIPIFKISGLFKKEELIKVYSFVK